MLVELLVRVVDKINEKDKYLDAMCRKAGDVIAWKKSPAEWGIEEVKNPEWRIVKADLTAEQCQSLIDGEAFDKAQPDKILRRNQMRLDITQLDQLTKGAITADQTAKVETIEATQADYQAALEAYAKTKSDKDWEAVITAEQAFKSIPTLAVDADVSKTDLMSVAVLKEPLVDGSKNSNTIGPTDSPVIGPG